MCYEKAELVLIGTLEPVDIWEKFDWNMLDYGLYRDVQLKINQISSLEPVDSNSYCCVLEWSRVHEFQINKFVDKSCWAAIQNPRANFVMITKARNTIKN